MHNKNNQNYSEQRVIHISESDLHRMIESTVETTLVKMGVDYKDPQGMQRDFQHLREWRTTVEAVKKKSIVTLVGTLITGIIALVVMGLNSKYGG